MDILNTLGSATRSCISRCSSLSFALILFSLCSQAISAPLPSFSDVNMQACFNEAANANNWTEAEDVDILVCANKGIVYVDGIQQLTNLIELDLSHNPLIINTLPPLYQQAQTLKRLNLSGTSLFDLSGLFDLQQLTHLLLNDINLIDASNVDLVQQQALDLLHNNPSITHLGLNGLAIDNPATLFNALSADLVSLELSNTGLDFLPVPLYQYPQLKVLDLSYNPIDINILSLSGSQTLTRLNLSGLKLFDLSPFGSLTSLTHLLLNNITLIDGSNADLVQQQAVNLLRNNPGLTHLGLNDLTINDPATLFNELSENLVSLELSNTGLEFLPVPLSQYTKLEVLDLSYNPINFNTLSPLYEQSQTLKRLNLSGTSLFDLSGLFDLQQLTHLLLNDINLLDASNADLVQQQTVDLVRNNPGITHLGLNGLTINDPFTLFNELSENLISLELSNTGLLFLPVPLIQYTKLEVLDLSYNPIDINSLSPLYQQEQTLKRLNLSGTSFSDLYALFDLQKLTHLSLNDMNLINVSAADLVQQQVVDLLRNNPAITHLGLNGIAIDDPSSLFNELSENLVSLELSNTGLEFLPVPFSPYTQLEVLDLSYNPININTFPPLIEQAQTLKRLNLSGTALFDLSGLFDLTQLTHLLLNDMKLIDASSSDLVQQQVLDLLRNNPAINHLGLNDLRLNNSTDLFNELSEGLVSLELSNTGLEFLPVPLSQYAKLEVLDLSYNPMDVNTLSPLYEQSQTLKRLNLSGTSLFDLSVLLELRQLTHLLLNDINLIDGSNADLVQQQTIDLVRNNPGITHLGLNGLSIDDPFTLFNELSENLISLELSNTGLLFLPVPLIQYTKLEVLDLSYNPIDINSLSPLYQQEQTLKRLNLSGTSFSDLYVLFDLQRLTHLSLNDMNLINASAADLVQQQVVDLLRNNPAITHLGLNGITINDPFTLFNELSEDLVSLELSNTGLEFLPVSFSPYTQLEVLDLSYNPININTFPPLYEQAQTLKRLNLSGTSLLDLSGLFDLTQLTHLLLNDMNLVDTSNADLVQQQVLDLLRNNPSITHLGLNGLAIDEPFTLFNELSEGLVSLELSNTGLEFLPIPLYQYQQLKVLDLSYNPIDTNSLILSVSQTLTSLNLSGLELSDLSTFGSLTSLTHLLLNDITFTNGSNADLIQQQVLELVRNNPGITHLGLNGLAINDPIALFNELSEALVSLELSNTGLAFLPVPLSYYRQLEVLDLSYNPIDINALSPLYEQEQTLKRLNLSGTSFSDLHVLFDLQRLTHLSLNDMTLIDASAADLIEQQVVDLLRNNPAITHLGLNGITINDPFTLFNELSSDLVSLELSNTGLESLSIPLSQFTQLERLILNNNGIVDISSLLIDFPAIKLLSLLGNDAIACDDLDTLDAHFGDNVELIKPTNCGGTQVEEHCSASGQNTSYEWIAGVSVNGQSNETGSDQGYGDYTNVEFVVDAGHNSVAIELTPGFSRSSYQENWSVWIDYNGNGEFESDEQIVAARSNGQVTASFDVPQVVTTSVRMRVAMQWGDVAGPCGNFTYGEVEDYSLFIINL